jgi:diguanylate cyclase (GGDEF)-like protein
VIARNRTLLAIKKRPRASLAVLVIVLFASILGAFVEARRFAADRMESSFTARADDHKDNLDRLIEAPLLVPAVLGLSRSVRELLKRPDPDAARELSATFEEIAQAAGVDVVYLMDLHGGVLASSNWRAPDTFVGRNYAFRPYFQEAIQGRTGRYTAKGTTSGTVGHYLARPVTVDGKILGATVVKISVDSIAARLRDGWRREGWIDLVADGNGVVFASPLDSLRFRALRAIPGDRREAIESSHQYGIGAAQPALSEDAELTGRLHRIRFSDLPDQEFMQAAFEIPELGFRLYLHVPMRVYWRTVAEFTAMFALAALVIVLFCVSLYQRWARTDDLIEAAIRDPLTGLHTRLYMKDWCAGAISAHKRDPGSGFGLAVFDLDLFKKINDVYGHLAGDAVLKGVGEIVRATIRGNDLAVRFGGEEIAVFVRCANLAEGAALAERIRQRVEQTEFPAPSGRMPVTLSGGVAYHAAGETLDALFARADAKLYEAKDTGRNRIVS